MIYKHVTTPTEARNTSETIFDFSTRRFHVVVCAEDEHYLDLSWDEDGEVARKLASGEYVAFCVRTSVYLDGNEIAFNYLSECIYESPSAYRNHFGIKKTPGVGSYFSDGIRECIREARKFLNNVPNLHKPLNFIK